MLRSSLLVVAFLLASASHAQVSSDSQAAAPVVYDETPLTVEDCNSTSGDGCFPNPDAAPVDEGVIADYAPDYAPDYWDEAPVYAAAPVYLGISLLPDYWGYYGYGYGYDYGYGWPYYGYASIGFGWPYYGYAGAYWGGGYWGGGWYGHGHHGGGDHGGWGHHGGDHGGYGHGGDGHGHHGDYAHDGGHHGGHGHGRQGDYPGPYRYLGNGRYADQTGAHNNQSYAAQQAATGGRPVATASGFVRSPATEDRGVAAMPQNSGEFAGANRARPGVATFGGRPALASSSYYAATRNSATATTMQSAYGNAYAARAGSSYRNDPSAGYNRGSARYSQANAGNATARDSSQGYRVTSMPNRGYAATRGGNSATYAPRSYGSRSAYVSAQQYAGVRGAYANANGYPYARQSGSYARAGQAYGGRPVGAPVARGGTPSYAGYAGSASYARGGQAYAGHAGGGSYAHAGPAYAGRVGGGGSAPHASSGGGAHAGSGGHSGSTGSRASHQH